MSIDTLTYEQWLMFWMILAAITGLAVGSFLNVLIWRVPNKKSIMRPASFCPNCKSTIRNADNIPVISYILLKGRCRDCKSRISFRYPFVELLNAIIWVISVRLIGLHIHTIGYLLFFSCLLALSVIDFDTKLLPKKIVYPAGAILVFFLVLSFLVTGDWNRVQDSVICGFAYFVFLFIIWFTSNGKAMGFGDVRLAPFLGFAMGYYGFVVSYMGMLVSFFIGAFLGIAIAAITKGGRKMKIPFGPFLAAGTVIAIWLAPQISELVQGYNV